MPTNPKLFQKFCKGVVGTFHLLLFNPVSPHSSPSSVRTPVNTYRPSQSQPNHHSKPLSHSLLLCLLSRTKKMAPSKCTTSNKPCLPANGRVDWTAGDRNKRSPFKPMTFIHLERSNQQHTSRKDSSRKKTRRPTARPCSLMDWIHHRSSGTSSSSTQHKSQPPQFRRGPPANQSHYQRFIFARGRPEASSLHGNTAVHHGQHHSTAHDKITPSKPRPHLSDGTTTFDINKYIYIYVCDTVVVNPIQP